MILFCDTSALIKLYVDEAYSDTMESLAEQATAVAVSRITWVEAVAALSRRAREQAREAADIEQCKQALLDTWPQFAIVEISQTLTEAAGKIADAFALRAYASMQLASARIMKQRVSEPFVFACFDRRLQNAASMLNIETFGLR